MEKTATLNLRVNPVAKQRAEAVLKELGIPMSTAMDMYLNQIYLVGGIPFSVTIPKTKYSANTDSMDDAALAAKLRNGVDDARRGNVRDAREAFLKHKDESLNGKL